MSLKDTHSLRRFAALLILGAAVAVVTGPTALADLPHTGNRAVLTWGCYPNDPNRRDLSGFTPDRSGLILVFGDWKSEPSGQRGALWGPTWGCYPNMNPDFYGLPDDLSKFTPDPSGFIPDPSGFTPDPSGFMPWFGDIAFAVALEDGSLFFYTRQQLYG
jgi:hypothetical protein